MKEKVSTILNLKEDLLMEEVFLRLSIKSIIRCKCVCKLWLKLLTHPRFSKLHLNQSNSHNPNLITIQRSNFNSKFCFIQCDSFDKAHTLTPKLPDSGRGAPLRVTEFSVVGSCNGLICLSDLNTFFSLWNPMISEYSEFSFNNPMIRGKYSVGFGYNHVYDEYKVVTIYEYKVEVYTIGANFSARTIEFEGGDGLPPSYSSKIVHVNGVFYWMERHCMRIRTAPITCFDAVDDDKFREVSWPNYDQWHCLDLCLGVLDGCLSVFCYCMERVDVWVMKEHGHLWTILFSMIRPLHQFLEPLAFRKNGEIVVQIGDGAFLVYDPFNQNTRLANFLGVCGKLESVTYVESLISIASLMDGNSEEKQQ